MNLRYGHLPLWDRIVEAIEDPEYGWDGFPRKRADSKLAADRILELLDQRGMLEGVTW